MGNAFLELVPDQFGPFFLPLLITPLPSQLPINGGGLPIRGEPLPILMEEPPRVPLPDIFLIIWLAPSLAAPAKVANPSVLPMAGATALKAGKTARKFHSQFVF